MPLPSLPNELLYMIASDPVLGILDLSNLCRTNRHLNTLLAPLLIRSEGKDNVLLFASEKGFVDLAQNALVLGAGVNAEDRDHDCTALQWAARGGHKLVTKLLLQHGASVASKDRIGWTALHWAAANDYEEGWESMHEVQEHEAVVCLLLDNQADINAQDCEKGTPLSLAIGSGNEPMVRLLLRKGADTSLGSVSFLESLAAGSDEEVIFWSLIEQDSRSCTTRIPGRELGAALLKAVASGNKQVVKFLLARGADLSTTCELTGDNVLQIAVAGGHESVAILLLEEGLDINITDRAGFTLLHRARCPELMMLLLGRGADVDVRDSSKQTPLHIMARSKVDTAVIGCINLLLANGANIEARDICGRTPLHRAVISSALEVVTLLLQHKASTTSQDDDGLAALHWVSLARRPDIVRLLVDAGADITVRSNNRRTLLHEIIHLSTVERTRRYMEFRVWPYDSLTTLSYRSCLDNSYGVTWEEMVKLLLDLGANAFAVDSTGYTPDKAARAIGWRAMSDIITKHRSPKVLTR